MKIHRTQTAWRNEGGMATLIFIVLLAIMMILVTAESRALIQLHAEVKLLEKQQTKRLNGTGPRNGSPTDAVVNSVPQPQ